MDAYRQTPRTTLKRRPNRAHYDRATIHAILDAGALCHVGYVLDGQPYVTPTAYWREDDRVYWHGSSASRMLRIQAEGVPVCFTVAHLDGFVLARSGFNHSINYRSVMALGRARLVEGDAAKLAALERFTEKLFPGRWREIRPPARQELRATTVLWLALDEVSAKIRTGPPLDDEPDYALPVWAGVLPLAMAAGAPVADPKLPPDTPLPDYLKRWTLG